MELTEKKRISYAPNMFEAYGEEEIQAVEKCLRDGFLAGFGKYSIEFEEKISKMFSKKYGIFVNSGSSANLLALACLGLPKGSEVITPSCTFSTTVAPIIQLGLKPIFCDVVLDRYIPSIEQIIEKITTDTKVIMIPNLIGNKPNWKQLKLYLQRIKREDIILIEDSCDTISETPESDISTTSFYASHLITAGGLGGMVMVSSKHLKNKILQYRDWGRMGDNSEKMSDRFNHKIDGIPYDHKFLYDVLGYNFKGSEMNAAFGLAQLNKFDNFKLIRRNNFKRYFDNLKDVKELILPHEEEEINWLAFPFQLNPEYTDKTRVELLTFLEEEDIQTRVTFAGNITRHPIYREYLKEFTNSDLIMEFGALVGCHHGMSVDDVDYVCSKIKEFFGKN